ncbi:MAG: hypothetical protein ACC662_05010, partial [Planctomycetota bacterium]
MKAPFPLVAAGGLALLLFAAVVRGDDDEDFSRRTLPFVLRPSRIARLAVDEARSALDSPETFDRGFRAAQKVLDELGEDFYRVESPAASTRWRLAAEEVRDLLAGLAPPARAAYDRFVSPAARPLLELALARRDEGLLREVVERYGASTPGRQAARLLASLLLEEGRPLDAAWWAADGLRYAPADDVLWRLRIDALGAAGARERLVGLAPPPEAEARGSLRGRVGRWLERLPRPAPSTAWPLWNGAPDRARHPSSPGPRPGALRWRSRLAIPMRSLDREWRGGWIRDDSRSFLAWWRAFRPIHPTVVDRVAYVANGRAVQALDLFTARTIWRFDESRAPEGIGLVAVGRLGGGRTSFERAFTPVVGGRLVFATVRRVVAM